MQWMGLSSVIFYLQRFSFQEKTSTILIHVEEITQPQGHSLLAPTKDTNPKKD